VVILVMSMEASQIVVVWDVCEVVDELGGFFFLSYCKRVPLPK
jgi:hypothetical protein